MRPLAFLHEAFPVTAAPARAADLTDPVEITARAWHHALNAATPTAHQNDSFGESFKTSARDGTTIYVRINERHVRFQGEANTPHHACIRHALTAPARHSTAGDYER